MPLIHEDAQMLDAFAGTPEQPEMKVHAGSFDFILDTIAADHDINGYLGMLSLDGNLTLVGAPEKPLAVWSFALLFGCRSLSGPSSAGSGRRR